MKYIQGSPRDQIILFPEAIDDYISEDNPVKFIDVYIDSLDMESLGFKHSQLNSNRQAPHNPKDILKLYIYGYLNRVRSSRRLEREAQRNLELMWLLRKIVPDHKRKANFRKNNACPIREVFKEFTLLCSGLELFGN